ncbi:hypothetical protein GCM10009715_32040 [Paeniglutamicibacter psychrophenolicus]|uniref:DUF2218 domain-containing protein n=1 Tax=Paeniglutamicibacter psychrophenolicus TaxID=257454 RepID=A0ABS4W9B0_9MICC|nr:MULTISPECIES: hypothetical protein [Micrococcaceae]MBP2372792.1 hypothetical protein [Paeniglutamicibacter psychrophenolicus]RAX48111.1 hypothetical protein DQ353_16645 [Arthrobacter sp. AQ5-05]
MNSEEVPQPHAADEYEVELEKSNDGPVRAAARWAAGLVDAFFGGDGSDAVGAAVVVHRIDNDAEVLRINAGSIEEAESLVAMVRSDLEELGHEEFLDRWGGRDGAEPAL